MPKLWVSYKYLRVVGAASILASLFFFYIIYSKLNLFVNGEKVIGTIIKVEHRGSIRSGSRYNFFEYTVNNQKYSSFEKDENIGDRELQPGDNIIVYVFPNSPTVITSTHKGTLSVGSYLSEKSYLIFVGLLGLVLLILGIIWLFRRTTNSVINSNNTIIGR